jgi:hypothetical protein
MSARIDIRDKVVALVKEMADFSDSNVSLYKLDRVDKLPAASIYLSRLNSEPSGMGGGSNSFERSLGIMIDFHSDHGTDADSQSSDWLDEIELLIYRAEKNGAFPTSLDAIKLDFAEFRPTATSKERRGDLVTVWVADFDEILNLSD